MNAAHLHLILNHLPIVGVIFATPILLIAWLRKSEILTRTGLWMVFVTGLLTIPTFLTGEPTEESIEHLPGISETLIKAHEEAAEKAIWVMGAAAVVAFIGLIISFRRNSLPKVILPTVLILSILSMAALAWTNNLGGEIRHSEIRADKGPALELKSETSKNSD